MHKLHPDRPRSLRPITHQVVRCWAGQALSIIYCLCLPTWSMVCVLYVRYVCVPYSRICFFYSTHSLSIRLITIQYHVASESGVGDGAKCFPVTGSCLYGIAAVRTRRVYEWPNRLWYSRQCVWMGKPSQLEKNRHPIPYLVDNTSIYQVDMGRLSLLWYLTRRRL